MPNDPIVVGGDILRLVTAGMYDNPLVLFREYLQNAADSIASRGRATGSVRIDIDPLEARLTITDNGPGLPHDDAVDRLIPIGNSIKNPDIDRGLRGIGRLSGLAFAENVHFTTRANSSTPVTQVSWSGRTLRDRRLQRLDAATAVDESTTVRSLPDGDWPDAFFRVTVEHVTRHAASALLNPDAVRNYVAEVCPVPISADFPLASEVTDFLSQHTDHFVLDVRLNADGLPIERPFHNALALTDSYEAPFERLETRIIPRLDSDDPAAILWLAHTPYAGSIPHRLGVRGLRARAGNIQVGSEAVFSHLFHETRFNGWCVGEVHITDSRIVPNGRRDYFEPGPHLRNLENHVGAVALEISARCRRASSHRNRLRQAETFVLQAESARLLARSGYLLPDDAASLLARSREQLSRIRHTLDELQIALPLVSDQDDPERCDAQFEPPPPVSFDGISPEVVIALQTAFGTLVETLPPDSALHLIRAILHQVAGRASTPDQ